MKLLSLRALGFCALAGVAVAVSGCGISLVGKQSENNVTRLKLATIHGLGDGRALFSVYDADLPENSLSAFELWSWDESKRAVTSVLPTPEKSPAS